MTYHVEEGEVLLGLDDLRQLLPLVLSGVDTRRVLCASVEQELHVSGPRDGYQMILTTEPSSAF